MYVHTGRRKVDDTDSYHNCVGTVFVNLVRHFFEQVYSLTYVELNGDRVVERCLVVRDLVLQPQEVVGGA